MGFGDGLSGYAAQYAAALVKGAAAGLSFVQADAGAHQAATNVMGGSGLLYSQLSHAASNGGTVGSSLYVPVVPSTPPPANTSPVIPVTTEATRIGTSGRIGSVAVDPDGYLRSGAVPKGPEGLTLPGLSRETGNVVAMAAIGLVVAKVLR